MKVEFKVLPRTEGLDVAILVDSRTVSFTSYRNGDDIEAAIPALVEKAKSQSIRAQALENKLNSQLNG